MTPAPRGTWDRRTEARQTAPVLCTPAMANDHAQSRELATASPLVPTKDPLTASSGRPSEEGGDGTKSRGSHQPQPLHFFYGTSRASYPSGAYAFH